MSIYIPSTANSYMLAGSDLAVHELTGNWVISLWINHGDVRCTLMGKSSGGPNNGFVIWARLASELAGSGYKQFEAYSAGAGGITKFSNAGNDTDDSNWHHWMLAKTSSTQCSSYVDGSFIETVTFTGQPGSDTGVLKIGFSDFYGSSFKGNVNYQDVRIYQSVSYDQATLAKILYESRGSDGYTDGLGCRYKFEGLNGTGCGSEKDLSVNGNTITDAGTEPTYGAAPFRGQ